MKTHSKSKSNASGLNSRCGKSSADINQAATQFQVLSPDGFPITLEPFASLEQAKRYIPRWCKRFKPQGYYSSVDYGRIPLNILARCVQIEALPPAS